MKINKMIKTLIEKIVTTAVSNNTFWKLLYPLVHMSNYLKIRRKKYQRINMELNRFNGMFDGLEVLNGPFKGMKYPDFKSVGSSFYPKLLGSYEKELHEYIDQCFFKGYSELIDVGCAEGYYAVGFALKNTNIQVHAYDTDNQARLLCEKMAKLNGVDKKISIKDKLDEEGLSNFKFNGKCLIICDAEGFEIELFTKTSIQNLKNCDLLIETHDFLNLEISTRMYELFFETHDIRIIKSVDDVQKVKYYHYPILSSFDLNDRKMILAENRPSIMEWLILEAKFQ